MSVKSKKSIEDKPKLIHIGDHYVDPKDVAGFKQAKKGLYILKLKSEPEPQYPMWVSKEEMEVALEHFEIIGDE